MAYYPYRKNEVKRDGVYAVRITPSTTSAPTGVYGIYGETDARVANYIHGKNAIKVMDAFAKTKYSEHYHVELEEKDTRSRYERDAEDIARDNDRRANQLYMDAIKQIRSFYQHSLIKDYGSEWTDYQPKGGLSSNSTK